MAFRWFFKSAIDSVNGLFSLKHGTESIFLLPRRSPLDSFGLVVLWLCNLSYRPFMRYTREEPIGIDDAFDYACDKFFSCFGGLAIPLLAIFGLTIPMAAIGFMMSTNFGVAIGGALWIVVLLLSLVIGLIGLGLMFAWPLIVSAISCEGQDSFDGMSRAFAYVFQRPVHYFCYAMIAVVFSGFCWLIASNLIEGTIRTAFWGSSWGTNVSGYRTLVLTDEVTVEVNDLEELVRQEAAAGRDLTDSISIDKSIVTPETEVNPEAGALIAGDGKLEGGGAIAEPIASAPTAGSSSNADSGDASLLLGKRMIRFWNNVARTLGAAFLYGMFWCLASAMYLLLRKDLDATEMDEIFIR